MWLWIGIGLGAFFALSVLVGLALAAMLGTISRGVTEMHEGLFDADVRPVQPPPERRRQRLRRRPHDEVTAHARRELEPHP
ncbi:MAG TPA: hypothetical protein VGH82_17310 [Gaiellaceae bacterium]|jgi:hypothetical protein